MNAVADTDTSKILDFDFYINQFNLNETIKTNANILLDLEIEVAALPTKPNQQKLLRFIGRLNNLCHVLNNKLSSTLSNTKSDAVFESVDMTEIQEFKGFVLAQVAKTLTCIHANLISINIHLNQFDIFIKE